MVYFLSKERNHHVADSFRRYQQYLLEHEHAFPPNAFALGTANWYYNPDDHRCPHDAWLENCTISETAGNDWTRVTSIRLRLLGAYQDGYIELVYPKVFRYALAGSLPSGVGDWRYDEFRLSAEGHLIHEIEWSGFPKDADSHWVIEASDIEFRWCAELTSGAH